MPAWEMRRKSGVIRTREKSTTFYMATADQSRREDLARAERSRRELDVRTQALARSVALAETAVGRRTLERLCVLALEMQSTAAADRDSAAAIVTKSHECLQAIRKELEPAEPSVQTEATRSPPR